MLFNSDKIKCHFQAYIKTVRIVRQYFDVAIKEARHYQKNKMKNLLVFIIILIAFRLNNADDQTKDLKEYDDAYDDYSAEELNVEPGSDLIANLNDIIDNDSEREIILNPRKRRQRRRRNQGKLF